MRSALHDLLEEAVPEPPVRLDGTVVLRAARLRRRARVATLGAAVAAAAAAVAVTLPGSPSPHRATLDPAAVPLRLSALDHRQPLGTTARERLAAERLVHPGEATPVGTAGANRVWLTETTNGQLCILAVHEEYGQGGYTCGARTDLLTRGLAYAVFGNDPHGPMWLVVVAPDGYTRATVTGGAAAPVSARIDADAAVVALPGTPFGGSVTIEGKGVPAVTFPVKGFLLPAPTASETERFQQAPARAVFVKLTTAAAAYRRAHGNLAGFVDALPPELRAGVARANVRIHGSRASTTVGAACLTADLLTGQVTQAPC